MKFHPAAELFPLMNDADFAALCADIRENGLREAIWIHEGQIIDGRNRFNACKKLKIEPRFQEWNGSGSLLSFVVSLNLNRRHLTESQRAMVAVKLANVDTAGRPKEITPIGGIISQADAAEMFSVSPRSISRAAKVQKDGVFELAELVETGEVTVTRAAELAELPKGKQKRLIRDGRVAGRKLLQKRKRQAVESMIRKGSHCLGCDPAAEFTAQTVSAFMQMLAMRAPAYARFFNDIVEELEVEAISAETRTAYDRILELIDAGVCEKSDLQRTTGLNRDQFNHTIATMLDYSMIRAVSQGGKTDTARGAAKTLYERAEPTAHETPELEYVEMEFD